VDAFMCYKQKCKVVSLNLAHPVHSLVCSRSSHSPLVYIYAGLYSKHSSKSVSDPMSKSKTMNGSWSAMHLVWITCRPEQSFLCWSRWLQPVTRNFLHQLKWILNANQLNSSRLAIS